MSTSQIEVRILGCLVEKERTTPEAYPLSTNALLLACNQKSNRDPVTNYHLQEVEETLRLLASKGMVSSVMAPGERAVKHRHMLDSFLGIGKREMAVLAVLMLRGPQTPGELRSRTERYTSFGSLAEVEETLQRLAAHQPPLVRNNGRSPGQSQDRWSDTFNPDPDRQRPRVRPVARDAAATATSDSLLAERVEQLQNELDWLYQHLGVDKPDLA